MQQIKAKSKERKTLVAEKKELPIYHVKRHKALAVRIAELTEDLEELRFEKALLLQKFEYAEDAGAEAFRKDIATMEACLKKLETREHCSAPSRKHPTCLARMQKNGRRDNSLCTEIKSSIEILSVNEKEMTLSGNHV